MRNFLRFLCCHRDVSRPINRKQVCFGCGAERFHNFHIIGEWHKPGKVAA